MENIQSKKILPALLVILLFGILKYAYKYATTDDVKFLLAPTNLLVELMSGSQAVYASETGFFHSELNMVIDKSCSGANFLLICFLMLSLQLLGLNRPLKNAFRIIPAVLLFSYLLTILTNSSRIYAALVVENIAGIHAFIPENILHESTGVFIYLSVLVCLYLIAEWIITNRNSDAKTT